MCRCFVGQEDITARMGAPPFFAEASRNAIRRGSISSSANMPAKRARDRGFSRAAVIASCPRCSTP